MKWKASPEGITTRKKKIWAKWDIRSREFDSESEELVSADEEGDFEETDTDDGFEDSFEEE